MKILITGAGAMGAFFATAFATAGHDVLLLARGTRAASLKRDGIKLISSSTKWPEVNESVNVVESVPQGQQADFVLLATKWKDLEDSLEQLKSASMKDVEKTVFVTVQNGVEAPSRVAKVFPGSTVLGGRVHGFFEMDGDAVKHVGVPPSVAFGRMSGSDETAEERFANLLEQSGITGTRAADIQAALWEKMVLASSLGGLGAALGVPAGKIIKDERHWKMLEGAMNECAGIAAKKGVKLPADCVEKTLKFVQGFPEDATTSLQRDIMAGRESEYDALPGAVVRMAKEIGVEVPLHEKIAAAILHGKEITFD